MTGDSIHASKSCCRFTRESPADIVSQSMAKYQIREILGMSGRGRDDGEGARKTAAWLAQGWAAEFAPHL